MLSVWHFFLSGGGGGATVPKSDKQPIASIARYVTSGNIIYLIRYFFIQNVLLFFSRVQNGIQRIKSIQELVWTP